MKNLIILLLITFILISCGGSSSTADPCNGKECPVRVHMVHIEGQNAWDYATSIQLMQAAIDYHNANNDVRVEFGSSVTAPDPEPFGGHVSGFGFQAERFHTIHLYAIEKRMLGKWRKRDITIVIDKPLWDEKYLYFAGRANLCGLYDSASFGINYVTPVSPSGRDNFPRSAAIIAHELGHLLGMQHESDCPVCIMNTEQTSAVHDFPDNILTEANRLQANSCVRSRTRWAVLKCRSSDKKRQCQKRFDIKKLKRRDVRYTGRSTARIAVDNDNTHGEIFGRAD